MAYTKEAGRNELLIQGAFTVSGDGEESFSTSSSSSSGPAFFAYQNAGFAGMPATADSAAV